MTEQSKREFFQLVVEKETTKCWSWIGEHDTDGRPVFRGDKAYRIMYQLRNGDVPVGFHVHHKCENSACINPRHLVVLSPEAHRAVHATKDKTLKERIYRGEWERIQAEKAKAERLAIERLEREKREQERLAEERRREQERLAEEERKRAAAMAAEEQRQKQMRRVERRTAIRSRLRKLRLYGLPALVCIFVIYFGHEYHWFPRGDVRDRTSG